MIIENVDIYNLIPSQIIDIIEKSNSVLNIVKTRKTIISKIAKFEKTNNICPHLVLRVLLKMVVLKVEFKHINAKNVVKDLMMLKVLMNMILKNINGI